MTLADDPNLNLRRIIVCAPMKSGSTYMANVIARYFKLDLFPVPTAFFAGDHNLSPFLTNYLRGHPFSFNFHMLPYELNMLSARQERILLFGVWRNLGDMFVSIDDHQFQESGNGPAFYVHDLEEYRKLPQEQRHLVRVDSMLQWYLRFYIMWRLANVTLHPYEQMLLEREAYFTRMLQPLVGEVDRAQLERSLGSGSDDRLNVGRSGRSGTLLSDTVKREIEARILRSPDWQQLEILLWELPWDVPAIAPRHPFDGHVVGPADGHVHFVSRGRRYPIARSTWLESRVGERRAPKIVDAAELEKLPLGAALF